MFEHNEASFQTILDASSDGIVIVDKQGIIQYANPAAEVLFGRSKEALIASPFGYPLIAGETTELDILRDNLDPCIAEMRLVEMRLEDDTVYLASLRDITLHKHQELELRKRNAELEQQLQMRSTELNRRLLDEEHNRLRTLIDALPDYIYVKDAQHRFVLSNNALARARGYQSAEEMLGKTDFDFFPKDLAQQFKAEETLVMSTGVPMLDHEQPSAGFAGGFAWGSSTKVPLRDLNGEIIGLVGITRDITAQKKYKQQLRHYASLQENASDAVISTGMDFRIQSWNAAAEKTYGWLADEVVGKSSEDIFKTRYESEQDRERVVQEFLAYGKWQGEIIQSHRDGHDIYIQASANLFKDEAGAPIGTVVINRDITERKKTEQALRAKMEEELVFQMLLKTLHEITIELTQLAELDDLYKQAVENGLSRLGFDRLAIILYDEQNNTAHGTYGTDELGKLTAEHDLCFTPRPHGIMMRAFKQAERFCFDDPAPLYTHQKEVGVGWNAAAALWNGTQTIGWLVADNFIGKEPAIKSLLDILALYALTLGSLISRKKEQIALRESEERFRLYFELPLIGMALTSLEKGWIQVNDRLCDILGYRRDELMQKTWAELTHPDDLAADEEQFNRVLAGEIDGYQIDKRFFHKAGQIVYASITIRAVHHTDGRVNYFVCLMYDITDRKQTEELKQSFLEDMKALQTLYLELSQIEDLKILYLKMVESAQQRLGIDRMSLFLLDQTTLQLHGTYGIGQDGQVRNEHFYHETITRHHWTLDVLNSPNRTKFWDNDTLFDNKIPVGTGWKIAAALWDGRAVIGYIVADNYITHKPPRPYETELIALLSSTFGHLIRLKQTTEHLRNSENRFRSVIEAAPDYILLIDAEGTIQMVNSAALQDSGYEPSEMIGRDMAEFFTPEAREQLLKNLPRMLEIGSSRQEAEFIRKDGSTVIMDCSSSVIYEEAGNPQSVIIIQHDITNLKQAQDTLRQALATEKELNELKSRFVSMASHEFRTPLATILALTETLRAYRHKMTDDVVDARLGKVQEQVGHLKDIMEDVLQLARLQARRSEFSPTQLNLDSLCRSVIDEFESRPDVKQKLIYTCDDKLHKITLDKKLMRQTINNLISNAIKYSPADKPIKINLEHTGKALLLKVEDEGIGIPEDDLKHIFEPFHRAANVGTVPGTGLGLVITKESVELHGGTISVESQLGVGTTITVNIPLATGGQTDD